MPTLDDILNPATNIPPAAGVITQSPADIPAQPKEQTQIDDSQSLSLADLYKKLNPYTPPTAEELQKEKKKQQRDQLFAAIGDGISALSNLYFTTKGAPSMYTGNNTASERVKIKYDKLVKDRKENSSNYFNGLMKAIDADNKERTWRRTLSLDEQERQRYNDEQEYKRAKDKEDREYKRTRDSLADNWKQKEFDAREKQYGRQNALAWANHNLSEQTRKDNKEIRQQQIKAVNERSLRGKQIGFSDGKGKQMNIYENVWKGSMQQVYDTIVEDFNERRKKDGSIPRVPSSSTTSAAEKDSFVKQNWHKSPRASQLMLSLSQIDPATMHSEVSSTGGGLGWGNSDNNETDW